MPRLATCMICAKIERMPDPPADVSMVPAKISYMDMGVERDYTFEMEDGTPVMVPEYDPILEDFVGRHGHNRPDTDVMGFIKLFPVDQATYDKLDVVTELKKELNEQTGLLFEEATYYKDEAIKCYNEHKNPSIPGNQCIDFLSDGKQIGPTVPKKYQTYLCHMCPYMQTYVAQEMRSKAGLYNPKKSRRTNGLQIAKTMPKNLKRR